MNCSSGSVVEKRLRNVALVVYYDMVSVAMEVNTIVIGTELKLKDVNGWILQLSIVVGWWLILHWRQSLN